MIIKDAGCIKFVSAIQSIEIIETTENDRPQASQSIPEHPRASQSIAEHRRASQSIAEHRKAARGINLAGMSRIDSSNQSENGEEGGSVAQHDQRIRQHPPASASIPIHLPRSLTSQSSPSPLPPSNPPPAHRKTSEEKKNLPKGIR